MRMERATVTPSIAKQWMKKNRKDQRYLRRQLISRIADDILEGRWRETGQGVQFDTDGWLIDGQHRLLAIIEADLPVTLWVAYDVEPEAFNVIDTGFARSLRDLMAREELGGPIANVTAALVRRVVSWEAGNFTHRFAGNVGKKKNAFHPPSNVEMLERFHKDPDGFVASAKRGLDIRQAKLGPATPGASAHYLFARERDHNGYLVDNAERKEQAENFFDQLVKGTGFTAERDPILVLRNRLISVTRERLRAQLVLVLYVRSWNAWREDRELTQLVTVSWAGLNNTNFPKPK